jgi:hypothetical protein
MESMAHRLPAGPPWRVSAHFSFSPSLDWAIHDGLVASGAPVESGGKQIEVGESRSSHVGAAQVQLSKALNLSTALVLAQKSRQVLSHMLATLGHFHEDVKDECMGEWQIFVPEFHKNRTETRIFFEVHFLSFWRVTFRRQSKR